jgi:hypothetical protein
VGSESAVSKLSAAAPAERFADGLKTCVQARQDGDADAAVNLRQDARHRDLREHDDRHALCFEPRDGFEQQLVVALRVAREQRVVGFGGDLLTQSPPLRRPL